MNISLKIWVYISIAFIMPHKINAQKVTVSGEISIRNNYAYEVFPNIDDHIIFYHDKGFEHVFEIYDNQLKYMQTEVLEFEKRNVYPVCILRSDTSLHFFYTYYENKKTHLKVTEYNKYLREIDTMTIHTWEKMPREGNLRYIQSENKSKLLFFTPYGDGLRLFYFDVDKKFFYGLRDIQSDVFNFKNEFEQIVFGNDLEVFVLGRREESWGRKSNKAIKLLHIQPTGSHTYHLLIPESEYFGKTILGFDQKNKRVVLAGLITSGGDEDVVGYYGFSMSSDKIPTEGIVSFNAFEPEFLAEATGKKVGKAKELSYLNLNDIVIRQDGGVLLICESVREFARRSQILNSPSNFGGAMPVRGYVDFYYDDVYVFATYPDGVEHWKQILFKKQFSQDDDGLYSSIFLFKTPSRLRILYNDEIKNNNTVSEYVLDGLGRFERKSVLSTQYQNLKLRFQGAIQMSPTSLIVPSEKSWKLNLVKIDFDQ